MGRDIFHRISLSCFVIFDIFAKLASKNRNKL